MIEREDVELLTAYASGAIEYEEYVRRGTARAEQLGRGPHKRMSDSTESEQRALIPIGVSGL